MALLETALEGDKEALGPPRSNPTLHIGTSDRLELPALGSVLVEELLELAAGHLAADQALPDFDDLVFIAFGHRLLRSAGRGA
jgi:hypothetical protein